MEALTVGIGTQGYTVGASGGHHAGVQQGLSCASGRCPQSMYGGEERRDRKLP